MAEKYYNKLFIKNMVCPRCITTVQNMLGKLTEAPFKVSMGEVELEKVLSESELTAFESDLKMAGFELIETRVNKIIEDIKKLIALYTSGPDADKKIKLSAFITSSIHYDYSYLSDLFSSIEGITIEQFFIIHRIEKVKELLVYEQLSLTEISYQTGFSSVHHLSAQFKKITGLTPSHFKKVAAAKRKTISGS